MWLTDIHWNIAVNMISGKYKNIGHNLQDKRVNVYINLNMTCIN